LTKANRKKGFILVLGGVRSGKSGFARNLCEAVEGTGQKLYLATATALDAEMERRIESHKQERGSEWATIEEPVKVVEAISSMEEGSVVLLDCLTLWLTNLMGQDLGDEEILERVDSLGTALYDTHSLIVAVSNEVGRGIMPVNAMARRFADISGLMNQRLAAVAKEVFLMTAGLATRLK